MLKNFWYVAADESQISNKPLHVKVLGQKFVVFKDSLGAIHCLSDICVHRGGSLSQGRVVGDCIECPYHGWQFSGSGSVKKIPAQDPSVKISNRAKIDAYPVELRYGWVWVFIGDLKPEQRPPIPSFPEFSDQNWRCIKGDFKWNADYARVVENGLDFSHAPFVHPSFGDRNNPVIEDFKVNTHEWGADATVSYIPPPTKGLWKLLRYKPSPVRANPSFHMSGAVMALRIHFNGNWSQVIYDVNTPVDENTTITRWIHARNFFTSKFADFDARRRVIKIFEQDAHIVENIQPQILPVDLSEELSVKSDALQIAYRKMRRNFIRRGWSLDARDYTDYSSKSASVIASPERTKDENKNIQWVLPELSYTKHGGSRDGLDNVVH